MFLFIVNIARVISVFASAYALYLLFSTLIEPDLMAPALAASAASAAVIAIGPYTIARMLGDAYRDSLTPPPS